MNRKNNQVVRQLLTIKLLADSFVVNGDYNSVFYHLERSHVLGTASQLTNRQDTFGFFVPKPHLKGYMLVGYGLYQQDL